MSKTEWLCPFNQFKSCDTDCRAYGVVSDGITPLDHNGCACLILDGIHGLGDIGEVAESLSRIDKTLFDTLGSFEMGEALHGIAYIGDVMPDMSDISESIDALARMINPTEYKQYMHEISQRLMNEVKTHEQEWQDFSLFDGDDAGSD